MCKYIYELLFAATLQAVPISGTYVTAEQVGKIKGAALVSTKS